MIESIAMRSILQVCSLLVVFLIAQSCEKEELKSENYFPVGRTSVLNNNLAVITNNHELTYELVYDGCGGYDGLYHYHHQWAEVCDEDGIWHTCDFGRINGFFINEINYLDLIYGPEENSTITGFTGWVTLLNDLEYWHNYPVAFTGSIPNFERVSMNWPDSIVVECTFKF